MVANDTKRAIHRLYDAGLDPLDIAVMIALSPDSIQRIISEYVDSDEYDAPEAYYTELED